MAAAGAAPAQAAAVADAVTAALLAGAEGARGLWLPDDDGDGVPRVPAQSLTRSSFFRDFVVPNRPVVITGAMDGWRARRLWDREYLSRGALGDTRVSVNVTPTGWADALHTVVTAVPPGVVAPADAPVRMVAPLGRDDPAAGCICAAVAGAGGSGSGTSTWFVKPEERAMSLREAVAMIGAARRRRRGADGGADGSGDDEVAYLSHQNDSLRQHTPQLLADLAPPDGRGRGRRRSRDGAGGGGGSERGASATAPAAAVGPPFHFSPWGHHNDDTDAEAEEEGGGGSSGSSQLEAVNLWLGDDRSTSSAHKDHFENLYAVVTGAKTFTLLPPTDVPWLYEGVYPVGRFARAPPPAAAAAASASGAAQPGAPPLVPGWVVVPEMAGEGAPKHGDNDNGGIGCTRSPLRRQATVPWVSVAVDGTPGACGGAGAGGRCRRFPRGHHARRLRVTVAGGEVLYLPALWLHQVGHAGGAAGADLTCAVNWWVDMRFDGPLWGAYSLARALAPLVQQQQQQQPQRATGATPALLEAGDDASGGEGAATAVSSSHPT
jgi:hypothetical protein